LSPAFYQLPSHQLFAALAPPRAAQVPARKLVNIPPAAIGGERCWSDFATIWTSKRARLLVGRVAMLAFIYYNSRVLGSEAGRGAAECSWEGCLERLEAMPELCFGATGLADVPADPVE
jgi:hypothetical protein